MWIDGLRLALTTFTVIPVKGPSRLDRSVAGWCMRFAPLIGALLGALLFPLHQLPSLLGGALIVAAAALLTRGMHLDGLADTVDALGSYRSRERALEVMKSPEVGAFGVAAIGLTILLQSAAISVVTWPGLIVAFATGRLAATIACQKGIPSAREDGLGALVAGTVGLPALAVNTLLIAAASVWAVPSRPWQGPIAVTVAVATVVLARRHMVKRLGGVTGDVLGFLIEVATTVVLISLSVGAQAR